MLFENKQKHVSLSFHRESAIFFIFFNMYSSLLYLKHCFPVLDFLLHLLYLFCVILYLNRPVLCANEIPTFNTEQYCSKQRRNSLPALVDKIQEVKGPVISNQPMAIESAIAEHKELLMSDKGT